MARPGADPARSRELLVQGARRAGALVQLKSERSTQGHCDGELYFLPCAPHARLFPRCSFVVHHGGAGTTHTVARAGVPSVAVYFSDEQRSWGDLLAKHGLAAAAKRLETWAERTAECGP